jgi:hypothetical protein
MSEQNESGMSTEPATTGAEPPPPIAAGSPQKPLHEFLASLDTRSIADKVKLIGDEALNDMMAELPGLLLAPEQAARAQRATYSLAAAGLRSIGAGRDELIKLDQEIREAKSILLDTCAIKTKEGEDAIGRTMAKAFSKISTLLFYGISRVAFPAAPIA